MSLASKTNKNARVEPSYVTLNKDGKPVWEPGLKAEVTSRRRHPVKKKLDELIEAPVSCDLKVTIKLSPEARAQWLEKALEAIPKGRAKPQDVFDIISHRKFVSGVPEDLGHKMLKSVKESLMFFSEKQQLNIAKCKLVKEFKTQDPARRRRRHDGEHDEDSDAERSSDDDAGLGRRHFAEAHGGRDEDPGEPKSIIAASDGKADGDDVDISPLPADLTSAEHTRIEREFAERERERQQKRDDELRSLATERKAHEEREKQRKAKIGNAFLMGGEEEDDAPQQHFTRLPPVEKRAEERARSGDAEGLSYNLKLPTAAGASSSTATSASTSSAIQTMGGDNVVNEAQQILQRGAGVFLEKGSPKRGESRSKSRANRRRSRSRSRRHAKSRSRSQRRPKEERRGPVPSDRRRPRVYDSLRSPTPDGHLRGQMRAARKAKMMAQMLQQGNVPRVA